MTEEKLSSFPDVGQTFVDDTNGAPPAIVFQHANDADEAMKAFEGHDAQSLVLDESTNRRLLRKIDQNILPVHIDHGNGQSALLT